jgi:hypothetical protein
MLGNLQVSFLKKQFLGELINERVIPPNLDTVLGNLQVSFFKGTVLRGE